MDLRVRKVIDIMHQSLSTRPSVRTLSQCVNLSPSRLRQLFKKETGKSPMGYLTEMRLAKAAQLIKGTFLSIKEVGALTGTGDASHFVRAFKRQYGHTPTTFRTATAGSPTNEGNGEQANK